MARATLAQQLQSLPYDSNTNAPIDLIVAFAEWGKRLTREINEAALDQGEPAAVASGCLQRTDERDVTPHTTAGAQQPLQARAYDLVREQLAATGRVALLVSALRAEPEVLCAGEQAQFVVYVDPLDGLVNVGINGELGSIFGVYRRAGDTESRNAVLRGGAEQIAAGYVLYGASTVFVFTTGAGVHGYTLDRARDEFVLTHEHIRCPDRGGLLGANLGRAGEWPFEIRDFIEHLTLRSAERTRYSLRYSGTVVAALHQSLLRGGVTFFPPDREHESGALQLLNDCAPLALIAEQAGGKASTGHDRILDMRAYSLHERSPLVIGSARDVELFERFMCGRAQAR